MKFDIHSRVIRRVCPEQKANITKIAESVVSSLRIGDLVEKWNLSDKLTQARFKSVAMREGSRTESVEELGFFTDGSSRQVIG